MISTLNSRQSFSSNTTTNTVSSLELLFNPLSGFFDGNDVVDSIQVPSNYDEFHDYSHNPICEKGEKGSIVSGVTQQESSEEPEYDDEDQSVLSDLTAEHAEEDSEEEEEFQSLANLLEMENESDEAANNKSSLPTPRLPAQAPPRKRKVRVWFTPMVTVIPVPSRFDYTPQERANMWSSFDEVHVNAMRNRIEYQYEGHDWRNVLEERHMWVDSNGELVHPAILEFVNLWWNQIGMYHKLSSKTPIHDSLLSIIYQSALSPPPRQAPPILV